MEHRKLFKCQICDERRTHDVLYVVEGYPVCRCLTCGVGRVDIQGFDPYKYYDSSYYSGGAKHSYVDYLGSEVVLRKEFSRTVEYLRNHGVSSGKLLEIGCAYGFFLQQAKQYYDVYGIEIVDEAVDYCKSNGLTNVKSGVLSTSYINSVGEVDVVVMLDVIEHIDNIDETMKMLSGALREGGVFLLTTGDWNSMVARITGRKWRLMAPPLHLWYFTLQSLKILGKRHGLEVISNNHPWKIVPMDLILQQLGIMVGLNRTLRIPKKLSDFGIPANLFDSMRVVFRKKCS